MRQKFLSGIYCVFSSLRQIIHGFSQCESFVILFIFRSKKGTQFSYCFERFPLISRPVNQNDSLQVKVFVASALDFRSQVLGNKLRK